MYNATDFVTLVNRTSKPIKGVWNGRHFDIAPGKHHYPLIVAQAIVRQNPVMGSQGHELYDVQYLAGIEEHGHDISPIEQTDKKELMDPNILHVGRKVMEIVGTTGLYGRSSVYTPPVGNGMTESSFEKP